MIKALFISSGVISLLGVLYLIFASNYSSNKILHERDGQSVVRYHREAMDAGNTELLSSHVSRISNSENKEEYVKLLWAEYRKVATHSRQRAAYFLVIILPYESDFRELLDDSDSGVLLEVLTQLVEKNIRVPCADTRKIKGLVINENSQVRKKSLIVLIKNPDCVQFNELVDVIDAANGKYGKRAIEMNGHENWTARSEVLDTMKETLMKLSNHYSRQSFSEVAISLR